MQSRQKYKILALMLCWSSVQAKIDLYGSAHIDETYLNIQNKLKLIPNSVDALKYWTQQDTCSAFQTAHLELQGKWWLDEDKGIIGGIDYGYVSSNANLTGMGTYEMNLSNILAISASGYFLTQSGSEVSAGLRLVAPKVEITSKADGLFFRGHIPSETPAFRPFSLQLIAAVSLPILPSTSAYISGGYGVTSFGANLPQSNRDDCQQYGLVEQHDTAELTIGDQLGADPLVLFNHINIGFRTQLYTQD